MSKQRVLKPMEEGDIPREKIREAVSAVRLGERLLPRSCPECGGLIPPPEQRDREKEIRNLRRQYNRLWTAAKAVSDNFEAYGSVVKVTVPMALLEKLQREILSAARDGNDET